MAPTVNVTDTAGGDEKLESIECYFAPFTVPSSGRGLRGVVVTPTAQEGQYLVKVETSQYGHDFCCGLLWDDPPQVAMWFKVIHPGADGVPVEGVDTEDYGMVEFDFDEEHSDAGHCGRGDGTENPERNCDFITSDGGIIIPFRNWIDPLNLGGGAPE